MSASSVRSDVDELFKLPLDQFTSARNALAAQLKKESRPTEASEAKALPKPSASAWVVNQLYWRHRESFDRLIEAGKRLRRTHVGPLNGEAVGARREALAELARIAADILRDGSHNPTRDLMRRVTSTLEALSSYASLPGGPVAGRLTEDLEPPGFEAVAGLLPRGEKGGGRGGQVPMRVPHAEPAAAKQAGAAARRDEEQRKNLIAAAKAAAREAERSLNAARKEAERAARKAEIAAKRAKKIEAERAKIERQLARVSSDAKAEQAEASAAAAGANEAERAVESAERALELARQRLLQVVGNKN